MRARAAALNLRLITLAGDGVAVAFCLAQRARAAAAMRARPAALMVRFGLASAAGAVAVTGVPRRDARSCSKVAIFSLMTTACLS